MSGPKKSGGRADRGKRRSQKRRGGKSKRKGGASKRTGAKKGGKTKKGAGKRKKRKRVTESYNQNLLTNTGIIPQSNLEHYIKTIKK